MLQLATLAGVATLLCGCIGKNIDVFAFPRTASGYTVTIVQSGTEATLLSLRPRYSLAITYDRARAGHYLDTSMFNVDEDMQTYARRCRVDESAEGLTFVQPTGHKLFIPKHWYEGGR